MVLNVKVILIDSGTTNSRIRLIDKESTTILDSEKVRVGVKDTAITGDNRNLISQLKMGIERILTHNQLTPADIEYIAASGMITSNLGVYEVAHIGTPASADDFATHAKVVELEDFFHIKCIFIPGMKNTINVDLDDSLLAINDFDVMRGEEVESFGLLKQFTVAGKGMMVLPGSHTKFVAVDDDQSLTFCLSTLGGETLQALQKQTILSDSLEEKLVETIDHDMLVKGYEAARQHGLTRSFYHIRLLHLFTELTANQRANYLVGAVIYNDLQALFQLMKEKEEMKWLIIGGSNPLRSAFTQLLKYANKGWTIIEATDQQVDDSLVLGAIEVVSRYHHLCKQ